MKKEHSSYRHPLHDAMAELIRQGASNKAVIRELGVNARTVARVRDILGAASYVHVFTPARPEEKVADFLSPLDDGHTGWTGYRSSSGQPMVRRREDRIQASRLIFEQRTGRTPVGTVKAECGMKHCLTPGHLSDEPERRKLRMLEREFYGLDPQPWEICAAGLHPWDTDGRLNRDLSPYCKSCNTQRILDARKERNAS